MIQQPIVNIQMVPAGIDLVIKALRKLPMEEVELLIAEIRAQADAQLRPAPAAPVAEKPRKPRTKKTKPENLGTVEP